MKKFWTLVCCMLPFTFSAQEHVTEPMKLSLDEGWRFHEGDIPFPEIKGHGASYANAKAGRSWGAAAPGYDDSDWRVLDLPHDWAVEQPFNPDANLSQGYRDRGYGWYRRTFQVSPEDKGKHFELHFDGIATYSTIWVNGTLLHRNWCGYTSSYIDITPYLNFGDAPNTIAVRVDAHSQEGWWYEGAGIYRHTWLIKRSPLHIVTDGIYANPIKSSEDNRWEIPVEVTIENSGRMTANAEVEVSLWSPNNQQIATQTTRTSIQTLRQTKVQLSLSTTAPMLWSPEKPTLYKVRTIIRQNGVKTDEVETRCGFRTFRFDPQTGFWLNGKNIKLSVTEKETGTLVDAGDRNYVTVPADQVIEGSSLTDDDGNNIYETSATLKWGWGTTFGSKDPATYCNDEIAGGRMTASEANTLLQDFKTAVAACPGFTISINLVDAGAGA